MSNHAVATTPRMPMIQHLTEREILTSKKGWRRAHQYGVMRMRRSRTERNCPSVSASLRSTRRRRSIGPEVNFSPKMWKTVSPLFSMDAFGIILQLERFD